MLAGVWHRGELIPVVLGVRVGKRRIRNIPRSHQDATLRRKQECQDEEQGLDQHDAGAGRPVDMEADDGADDADTVAAAVAITSMRSKLVREQVGRWRRAR